MCVEMVSVVTVVMGRWWRKPLLCGCSYGYQSASCPRHHSSASHCVVVWCQLTSGVWCWAGAWWDGDPHLNDHNKFWNVNPSRGAARGCAHVREEGVVMSVRCINNWRMGNGKAAIKINLSWFPPQHINTSSNCQQMYEHSVLTKRGVSGLNVTVYDAVISSRSEETNPCPGSVSPQSGGRMVEQSETGPSAISRQKLPAPRPPLWRLNGNINIQAGRGVEPSPSTLSTSPHCAELRPSDSEHLKFSCHWIHSAALQFCCCCCCHSSAPCGAQCRVSARCITEYAAQSTVCEATFITSFVHNVMFSPCNQGCQTHIDAQWWSEKTDLL